MWGNLNDGFIHAVLRGMQLLSLPGRPAKETRILETTLETRILEDVPVCLELTNPWFVAHNLCLPWWAKSYAVLIYLNELSRLYKTENNSS